MQRAIVKMQRLNWDDVRVFLALLRSRGLVAAARDLGIDKSTVSRRIASLEQALGARLFLRTPDGLRPSALAESLRTRAELIESELHALSGAVVAGDDAAGLVRLATTEGLAVRLVSLGLLTLTDENPGLELEILGGNAPVDLARGEADLALRVLPITGDGLKARVVARMEFSLFASPAYLARRGRPRSAAQLGGHDVLLPTGELARLPEARWLASRPGVRVALRSSSLPALATAAVQGFGLVPLTNGWGSGMVGLEAALPLPHIAARPIWLATHPDVAGRPAVKVVAARIAELFRNG